MHLLFVCNEYPPSPHGGIGTFVLNLSRNLVKQGHRVTVLGYDGHQKRTVLVNDNGTDVYRIRKPFQRLPSLHLGRYEANLSYILERWYLSLQVQKVIEAKGIDLVESYDWSGPLWMRPSAPLIIRLHGANTAHALYEGKRPSRLLRFVERKNVKLADRLIAVSNHIGNMTLQAFNLSSKKYTVIYNGVDPVLFAPTRGIERMDNLVLFAGSIHPRKGIFELFKAMALVFVKNPFTKLILAGNLPPDADSLKQTLLNIIPFDFRSSVRFLGYIPHQKMPLLYSQATLAVFPSLAEAFGLTCTEAMACATPVVMTSRASGPEVVEDQISGLLVEPTNSEAFAEAILRLLEDRKLRLSLSQRALERVQQKFALPLVLQQNLSYYHGLVA
jgi:glycosyltransferase involved in cell wall biosynthesis